MQKFNSLGNYFINLRSAKKKDFTLKVNAPPTQTLSHIEHHESMDCLDTESYIPESQEMTEEKKMKTEEHHIFEKIKEPREEKSVEFKTVSEKFSQKLPIKIKSKSSIILEDIGGPVGSSSSPGTPRKNKIANTEEETNNDFLWKNFEKAHYYETYFPKNNLEYIIQKWARTKYIMKRIHEKREGVAENYKKLKNYYFNADAFLEKITKENLVKKKSLRKIRSTKNEKKLSKYLAVSPSKKAIFSLKLSPKKDLKEKPNLIELDQDKRKSNRRMTIAKLDNLNSFNQKEKKIMK